MMDLSDLNSSEEKYSVEEYYYQATMVVYGLVFVVGALGNGVVVWATAFKLKRTASTVWFLNLAVSDLLFAATLPLSIMHQALDYYWPLGRVMCKLYFTMDSLTMFASVYLLVVIGVDRCVSVAWPSSAWVQMNRGAWRRKASYVSVAVVWALAAVLSSPLFFSLDTPSSLYGQNTTRCTVVFTNSSTEYYNYEPSPFVFPLSLRALDVQTATFSILGFVVPLVVIVSCYAVILWRRRTGGGGRRSPLGRPFSVRVAVTASFFLCVAPYNVLAVVTLVPTVMFNVANWLLALGKWLLALYRCLNPLLYATVGRTCCTPHGGNKEYVLEVLESAFAEDEEPQSEPSADLPLSDKE